MPPAAASPASTSEPVAGAPQVSLRWIKQSDIVVGQECRCTLAVANASKVVVNQVVVNAYVPPSVRMLEAQPVPVAGEEQLTWTFATLAPGEEKQLQKLVPAPEEPSLPAAKNGTTNRRTASGVMTRQEDASPGWEPDSLSRNLRSHHVVLCSGFPHSI